MLWLPTFETIKAGVGPVCGNIPVLLLQQLLPEDSLQLRGQKLA
jgi:hypothetical protein